MNTVIEKIVGIKIEVLLPLSISRYFRVLPSGPFPLAKKKIIFKENELIFITLCSMETLDNFFFLQSIKAVKYQELKAISHLQRQQS